MPIFLPAPTHRPSGPDGQGWNRLRVESVAFDQCALQPLTYASLWESHNTPRAGYGYKGHCVRAGACEGCPILAKVEHEPFELGVTVDRVLVRTVLQHKEVRWGLHPITELHVMNDPNDSRPDSGRRVEWFDLVRLRGWKVGRRHSDEHSDGFWLERLPDPPG